MDNLLKDAEPGSSMLVQLFAKPGYILPARDYVFRLFKAPGGVVGCNDFTSIAFIGVDSSHEIQRSWWNVRGNMNNILLLRPSGTNKTKATYLVEFSYAGWIPTFIVDVFAENVVKRTMSAG